MLTLDYILEKLSDGGRAIPAVTTGRIYEEWLSSHDTILVDDEWSEKISATDCAALPRLARRNFVAILGSTHDKNIPMCIMTWIQYEVSMYTIIPSMLMVYAYENRDDFEIAVGRLCDEYYPPTYWKEQYAET